METMTAVNGGFHHDVLADCRKICINVTKPARETTVEGGAIADKKFAK